jgi:hypothetical protein
MYTYYVKKWKLFLQYASKLQEKKLQVVYHIKLLYLPVFKILITKFISSLKSPTLAFRSASIHTVPLNGKCGILYRLFILVKMA